MRNMYFLTDTIADEYFEKHGFMYKNGVYKLGNERVVKKLDIEKSQCIYDTKYSESQLLQFKDINIDNFSFTKALVYTGLKKIYGMITEHVDGCSLEEKSLSRYEIDDVITAVSKLETSVKKLSGMNICVNDVHSGNIIFDGKRMTMIDTTEYYYSYDSSYLLYENMEAVMDTIFRDIFFSFYNNQFMSVYKIHKYFSIRGSDLENFRSSKYLVNPTETLLSIRKFMEEDFGVRLDTFGESHWYIDNVIVGNLNNKVRQRK